MRVADIALGNRSQVVIIENVPAALSGAHRRLWEAAEDRLRLGGYNVRRIVLDGRECGLAQRRKRLFLICWRGSDCIGFIPPRQCSTTLRSVLEGVGETEGHEILWPEVGTKDWIIARHIPAGHRLSNVRVSEQAIPTWAIPEIYGQTTADEKRLLSLVARLRRRERTRSFGDGDPVSIERLEAGFGDNVTSHVARLVQAGYLRLEDEGVELRQTYNGRYRRLHWEALSPTVDTRFGRMDLFLHPDENRGMTPREAARIQGFPDAFGFLGRRAEKFSQIGNAVPPPMAAALAEFVREAILKA